MNEVILEALVVFKTVGGKRPVPVQQKDVPDWVKDPVIMSRLAQGLFVSNDAEDTDPEDVAWWSALKIEELRRRAKGKILR
jgi:hypothetical protein